MRTRQLCVKLLKTREKSSSALLKIYLLLVRLDTVGPQLCNTHGYGTISFLRFNENLLY